MTTWTAVPGGTLAPAPGRCWVTTPVGYGPVTTLAWVVSPRDLISRLAALQPKPSTFGTLTVAVGSIGVTVAVVVLVTQAVAVATTTAKSKGTPFRITTPCHSGSRS